jgi:hypothetical protein
MKFNATNDLSTLQLFRERRKYRNYVNIDRSVDLWYDKPWYGKVNRHEQAVCLSETNLKQIPTSQKTIFVIDFVAEAYKDLKDWFNQNVQQQRAKSKGPLGQIEAENGWTSVSILFHAHTNMLYEMFILQYLMGNKRTQLVHTFEDFIKEFMTFLDLTGVNVPFLKSTYIISNYCPNTSSGLIIELNKNLHSIDPAKQKFIEDPNFKLYQKAALKFGFYINKNAPFQLIFNVGSLQAQNYMKKYGISFQPGSASNLFEIYYYLVNSQQDIDIMKSYLIQFYQSFITAYPQVVCKNKTHKRAPYMEKKIISLEDSLYWFKMWVLIKFKEGGIKFNQHDIDSKVKKAEELFLYLDKESAMRYIEKEVKNLS